MVSSMTAEYTAMPTHRHAAAARSHPILSSSKRRFYQALTSERVRQGERVATKGNHAVYPRSPTRPQALRLLDHGELSRGYGSRLERHPVQSRRPDPRARPSHRKITPRSRRSNADFRLSLYRQPRRKRDWPRPRFYVAACGASCSSDARDYVLATARPFVRDSSRRRSPASAAPSLAGHRRRRKGRQRPAKRSCRSIPRYFPATEVDLLLGDRPRPQGARLEAHHAFDALVRDMVEADLARPARTTPPRLDGVESGASWNDRCRAVRSKGKTRLGGGSPRHGGLAIVRSFPLSIATSWSPIATRSTCAAKPTSKPGSSARGPTRVRRRSKVGGIKANDSATREFLYDNLAIELA